MLGTQDSRRQTQDTGMEGLKVRVEGLRDSRVKNSGKYETSTGQEMLELAGRYMNDNLLQRTACQLQYESQGLK